MDPIKHRRRIAFGTCCFQESVEPTGSENDGGDDEYDGIFGFFSQRRRRFPRRIGAMQQTMWKFPLVGHQVVLIHVPDLQANNPDTMFLCRLPLDAHNVSLPITTLATLRFDTSIQVVRHEAVAATHASSTFDRTRVQGWLDLMDQDESEGQEQSGIVLRSCFHPHMNSCGDDDDKDIVRNRKYDMSNGFVELMGAPTPLFSIRLWYHRGEANELSSQEVNNQPLLLLQTCLKRNLVGCVLLWKENQWNTTIRLPNPIHHQEHHTFSIESAKPKLLTTNKTNESLPLFSISASTVITFLPTSLKPLPVQLNFGNCSNNEKHDSSTRSTTAEPDAEVLSHAAQLLQETLDICLHQQQERKQQQLQKQRSSSNLQIPRSFMLTGPPGTYPLVLNGFASFSTISLLHSMSWPLQLFDIVLCTFWRIHC